MSRDRGVPARVALFFGWVDSPVWYRTPDEIGPVDLETLPISADLRARLYLWNDHAGAVLSKHEFAWPNAAAEDAFTAAGSRLAQELRNELGIEVIYKPDGDVDTRPHPPPTQQRIKGRWTAYAPLSGRTYRPRDSSE